MITYKNVPYRFDTSLWAAFCKVLTEKHGREAIAGMIDVHPNTITGWINGNWKMGFEHPSMNKFLTLCNLADTNPSEFFTIQDAE